jgi:hypothetical protein
LSTRNGQTYIYLKREEKEEKKKEEEEGEEIAQIKGISSKECSFRFGLFSLQLLCIDNFSM